jgi:polysaccharide biosynthesis/export protein
MKAKCSFSVLAIMLLCSVGAVASDDKNGSTSSPQTASSGASTAQPSSAMAKGATEVAASEYTIGSEDVLAINVWKDPEISRVVPVRPDGKVTLPLIGDVQAKSLTPKQLQANIAQALRSYLANPEVSVIVQEVRSQKFNVLGEVLKPGSYPLSTPTTVLEALAVAGGFRDFAKVTKIYILRMNADSTQQKISFNYKEVVKGKRVEQNVVLQSHDTVIVP